MTGDIIYMISNHGRGKIINIKVGMVFRYKDSKVYYLCNKNVVLWDSLINPTIRIFTNIPNGVLSSVIEILSYILWNVVIYILYPGFYKLHLNAFINQILNPPDKWSFQKCCFLILSWVLRTLESMSLGFTFSVLVK